MRKSCKAKMQCVAFIVSELGRRRRSPELLSQVRGSKGSADVSSLGQPMAAIACTSLASSFIPDRRLLGITYFHKFFFGFFFFFKMVTDRWGELSYFALQLWFCGMLEFPFDSLGSLTMRQPRCAHLCHSCGIL